MRLADRNIDVPGIADVPAAVAAVIRRAPSLAGRPLDHVTLCVAAANLLVYAQRVRTQLPASRFSEYRVGDADSGMWIAEIEDSEAAIHVVLAAPTGAKGQLAEFLAQNGAEGLQHVAFAVPDLGPAMADLQAQGFRFVGGADEDQAVVEVREGDCWLRQAFTEPLSGGFFLELVERHGITGMRPRNIESLYTLKEDTSSRMPQPA